VNVLCRNFFRRDHRQVQIIDVAVSIIFHVNSDFSKKRLRITRTVVPWARRVGS
jgi:hypothetical protein